MISSTLALFDIVPPRTADGFAEVNARFHGGAFMYVFELAICVLEVKSTDMLAVGSRSRLSVSSSLVRRWRRGSCAI